MIKTKKKRKNIIVAYFKPFGLSQVCDILTLISTILMVVGAFVNETVLLVGLIMFLAVFAVLIATHVMVLVSKINRRSPEYRNAIVNTVICGVLFIIALFGLIYFFVR